MASRTSGPGHDNHDDRLRRWLIPALDLADEAAKGYTLAGKSPTTDSASVATLLGRIAWLIVRHFQRLEKFEKPVTLGHDESQQLHEVGVPLGTYKSGEALIHVVLATRLRITDHIDIAKGRADLADVLNERLIVDDAGSPLLSLGFGRFKAIFQGLVELLHEAAMDLPVNLTPACHPTERSRALVRLARGYDTVVEVMES